MKVLEIPATLCAILGAAILALGALATGADGLLLALVCLVVVLWMIATLRHASERVVASHRREPPPC